MQRQNSRSGEHEISILFREAIKKLDKIDTAATKEKTHVVQDLAKNLEGKIPTETISIEIVHQLRGKVSERLVHECLDEKYKQKRRVENARKQKGKNQGEDKNLAAPVPLNRSKTGHENYINNNLLVSKSGKELSELEVPLFAECDKAAEVTIGNSEQSLTQRKNVNHCPQCPELKLKISELEEALTLTKQFNLANELSILKANKIKEPEDLLVQGSDSSRNVSTDFEFRMEWEEIRRHMSEIYESGHLLEVWFNGKINKQSGKVTAVYMGRIRDRPSDN